MRVITCNTHYTPVKMHLVFAVVLLLPIVFCSGALALDDTDSAEQEKRHCYMYQVHGNGLAHPFTTLEHGDQVNSSHCGEGMVPNGTAQCHFGSLVPSNIACIRETNELMQNDAPIGNENESDQLSQTHCTVQGVKNLRDDRLILDQDEILMPNHCKDGFVLLGEWTCHNGTLQQDRNGNNSGKKRTKPKCKKGCSTEYIVHAQGMVKNNKQFGKRNCVKGYKPTKGGIKCVNSKFVETPVCQVETRRRKH